MHDGTVRIRLKSGKSMGRHCPTLSHSDGDLFFGLLRFVHRRLTRELLARILLARRGDDNNQTHRNGDKGKGLLSLI